MNFSFVIKFSILLTIPCLLSCDPWSSETEEALKLAGENRVELEKVLRHYDKIDSDPLKFKAAEYLISNMQYQYSIFGPGIDSLNKSFEYVYGVYYKDRNPVFRSDSVKRRLNGKREVDYDLLRISSDQLIEQIESAFDTYNRFEWCRQYPFELFCEYILPYRVGNSDPVDWRSYAYDKYGALLNHSAFDGPEAYFEAEHFANGEALKVATKDASGQWAYHLQRGDSGSFEMEFETQVPGFQLINVHYLNGHTTAAKVRIRVDSLSLGDFTFPATGDWELVNKDVLPIDFTVRLDAGRHTLKMMAMDKDILVDFVHIPEFVDMRLPQSIIPEGKYYLTNRLGKVTVPNDSLANGVNLKVDPNPSKNWLVNLIAKDGSFYNLVFEDRSGTKKAIDAFPNRESEKVHLYDNYDQQNQKWAIFPGANGGFYLRNKGTGNILAYSEADSSLIQLPQVHMHEKYLWHLVKAEGATEGTVEATDMSMRAAQKVSEITDRFHWSGTVVEIGPINPTYLLDFPFGSCVEETDFQTMVLRSMGVACAVDFLFCYPERNAGHSWSVIFDLKGNTIQNNCHAAVGAGTWVDVFAKGKVYRKTNTINHNSLFMKNNGSEPIPTQFQTPYFMDVTNEYCEVADVKVKFLTDSTAYNDFGYLMVFNYRDWVVTGWGERDKDIIMYRDVEPGVMYLPALFTHGDFEPFNAPFFFDSLGYVQHKKASEDSVQTMTLKRKFPNRKVDESYHKRIVGGKFQGANKPDFSDSVTIGTITSGMTEPVFHTIDVSNSKAFKYIRYLGPSGGHCNISELVFIGTGGGVISGEIIGTEGSFQNSGRTKEKAFDGDVLTYFDSPIASGNWTGLKLDKPSRISKIRFVARNDGNMVEIGDEYELVYWDSVWVSVGKQIAKTDSLVFENVPTNALYLLHNLSKGWEERIFTYEDGKQVWW